MTLISSRKLFVPRDTELTEDNLWMKDVPLATREEPVRKAIVALKTGFKQLKNKTIAKFQLGFRSRKRCDNVFYCSKKSLKPGGALFTNRLKEHKYLKARGKNQELFDKNCGIFSIIQTKDKRYYACLVVAAEEQRLEPRENICALDPGVRTFQTMYSQKSIGEFGNNTSKKLDELYHREDKLKSILSKEKLTSAKKYKLKQRCALLRTKIANIVTDLHWKTADYLTKTFQVVLLPIFATKQMVSKSDRNIGRATARHLYGLSHYSFQQKLLYKAKVRGRQVILCKEHYTSKCCGNCGELNEKLGSKKVFECSNCGLVADRDLHAARNILIRALSLYYGEALGQGISSLEITPKSLKTSL
jgi:putative transposase